MLQQIIGSAVIVMASGKIGYDTASKYGRRVKEIQAMQSGLWGLKSNIAFCRSTMYESMMQASGLIPTNAAKVFADAAELLNTDCDVTASSAWHDALAKNEKSLALKADELGVLYTFGSMLGTADAAGEIENIELTIEKLKIYERDARAEDMKYGRMCKSLGIVGGVLLAIVFI